LLQRHWPNASATKGQKGLADILLENVGEEDVKKIDFPRFGFKPSSSRRNRFSANAMSS